MSDAYARAVARARNERAERRDRALGEDLRLEALARRRRAERRAGLPGLARQALEAMLHHSGVAGMDLCDKLPDDVIAESLARKALAALGGAPAEETE